MINRVRRNNSQAGFTLIELLVVIAVLAILATIVLFNVIGVSNRGHSSACATDVKTVQSAVDADINDNGSSTTSTGLNPGSTAAIVSANLSSLQSKGYLHTNATSCSSMSFTEANGTDWSGGATVTGS